ncbi:MAG: hypothetical protein QNK29_14430 [Desulfobacterales bacterium]|nr:hypothetical protein [Desulfobacterales bacterium]
MQILDAIIAFTLTMAALATVVTVLMETLLRVVSMRKKNMVDVMRLLNKELGKGHLNMTDEERWFFFTKVVENVLAEAAGEEEIALSQKPQGRPLLAPDGNIYTQG